MLFKNIGIISTFEEYLRERKRLADTSVRVYVSCIEQFLSSNPDVNDLESYNQFLIAHAIKKRSRYYYSILRTFIEFNTEDTILKNKLIAGLINPPETTNMKKERVYLSEEQLLNLINRLSDDKHKVMALIQTTTGVRSGDVLKIRRGNIIPETYKGENVLRIIINGKGNKRNVVYIHDNIIQTIIMNYIIQNFINEEFYFLSPSKNITQTQNIYYTRYKVNYKNFLNDLKAAMDQVGLENHSFATHDFRRCFARRVWTRYKDLQVLQDLLNHQNPTTTMRYLKGSGLKNVDYHKELQSL